MKLKDEIKRLIDQTEDDYNKIGEILNKLTSKLKKAVANENEFNAILQSLEMYKSAAEANRNHLKALYEKLEAAKLFDIEDDN